MKHATRVFSLSKNRSQLYSIKSCSKSSTDLSFSEEQNETLLSRSSSLVSMTRQLDMLSPASTVVTPSESSECSENDAEADESVATNKRKFLETSDASVISTKAIQECIEDRKDVLDDGLDDAIIALMEPPHLREDNALTRGMRYLREREKVFMAVDLEYWEVNNKFLTEIGITVYDPTYLGKGTNPIFPKIRTCHYIVNENKNKTNGRFVPNNMFKYSFGESLVMSMNECRRAVDRIMAKYAENENLVIVGHNVGGDITMLKKNKFAVPEHEVLDTYKIWKITPRTVSSSLSSLLKFFDVPHALMHNAGNDSYLNMLLYFAMCDPAVRKEKHLDDASHWTSGPIANSNKKKKGAKDVRAPRKGTSDEAITLMLGD